MGLIARREDWAARLAAFVATRQQACFVWGATDCVLFAADWVREATGVDHAAAVRGHYSTAASAAQALRRYGAGDLAATVTARLGPPLVDCRNAQRGDLVLVTVEPQARSVVRRTALGVCIGADLVCLRPDAGLVTMPMRHAVTAWRV